MMTRLICVALLGIAGAAHAADGEIGTFGQLDKLRAENALLDAQVKNAELKKKLNEATGTVPANSPAAQASAFVAQTKSASVVSVSGTTAVIQLANGSSVSARPGSRIPGLGTVKQVSVREVVIADGKNLVTLPFSGEGAVQSTAPVQGQPMMIGSPMVPQVIGGR